MERGDGIGWDGKRGRDGRGWLTFDLSRKGVPLPWRVKAVSRGLC